MNGMLRVGVIGLGAAARRIHLPALRGIPAVDLVGGVDAAAGSDCGMTRYANLESLVSAARPDLIVIATPPDSHVALAREALARGCHVLLEKPMALTASEGAVLVDDANREGRLLAVNTEFRFMRSHAAARGMVGDPRFGALKFAHLHQQFRADASTEKGWRGDSPERTCTEFGVHALDLARFFFDCEPLLIEARMAGSDGPTGPDMLNLIDLDFGDGRFARITLDRLTRGRHRYLDCRLDGAHSTVETELGGALELKIGLRAQSKMPYTEFDFSPAGRAFLIVGERRRKIAREPLNLFAAATEQLVRRLIERLAEPSRFGALAVDAFRSFALMRGAYDSARQRRELGVKALYGRFA